MKENQSCRLCGGKTKKRFSLKILNKYDVSYFHCQSCESLQTENPYWLDDAYKNNNLSNLDTGVAQRNIHNLSACYLISKLFNIRNIIDIGGGDGLLCRLLRDYELNCFTKDKYTNPKYAQGYTKEDFKTPDLVIGFELLEHFSNPSKDLDELFRYGARLLLFSTETYENEDKNWWYLSPESGQHIFFYSKKALHYIAEKYGYQTITSGSYTLFSRNTRPATKYLAKILLSSKLCRLAKAWIITRQAKGVWKDHITQRNTHNNTDHGGQSEIK